MCGVAAIFAYHDSATQISREELVKIRDAMRLRGPDGYGEWYSEDGRVGLAHRRLAIIDLGERGLQPMESANGKVTISFNGEIYNYRELRYELESKGYRFRTESDTEVLLCLYSQKGMGMLADLRGMFAFALWDKDRRQMFLARDPYGIKPLYYANDGKTIRVASQVKALLAGGRVSRQIEPAAKAGFYIMGSVPEPWTIYEGVMALPAGNYLQVNSSGISSPKVYIDIGSCIANAVENGRHLNISQATEQIHVALRDSIKAHLVSDVPVGIFLSSGIDSCSLAALVSENREVEALTLGFQEYIGSENDEISLASSFAAGLGLKHTVERVGRQEFVRLWPHILNDMDQPSIDGVNTWLVSRAAARRGWKVAISGIGGDELFGGYSSFRDIPDWVKNFSLASKLPFLGNFIFSMLSKNARITHPKVAGLVKYGGDYASAYLLKRALFLPDELPQIMGKEQAFEGLKRLDFLPSIQKGLEEKHWQIDSFKISYLESAYYLRNQLLRDSDWAGMAHSLEIRTPLVDIDFLIRVAPALTVIGHHFGKQALATAPIKPLPKYIYSRVKTGFTVPISNWQQQKGEFDIWQEQPSLRRSNCPWARRWAYVLMRELDMQS